MPVGVSIGRFSWVILLSSEWGAGNPKMEAAAPETIQPPPAPFALGQGCHPQVGVNVRGMWDTGGKDLRGYPGDKLVHRPVKTMYW